MGDDIDAPHNKTINIEDSAVATIVSEIISSRYLANIAGGKATWILRTHEKRTPLVVISQQRGRPQYLIAETDSINPCAKTGNLKVYVEYYCQADPKAVYDALLNNLPLPDRYSY